MSVIFFGILIAVFLLIIKHLYAWSPADPSEHYHKKPVFFAHRGLMHLGPENTEASFKAALDNEFEAVEYDVVGTLDGEVICSHNFDLERKTNGKGWIADLSWNEIENVKTGPPGAETGLTRLEDALNLFPDTILQNIEIKTSKIFDIRTALNAVSLIRKYKKEKNVILSSFNPFTIWAVKMKAPDINTGFILETMNYFGMVNLIHPDFLHPSIDILNNNLLKFARDRNLGVNVWTVNNRPSIQNLLTVGVDGVITDRHELHPEHTTYDIREYGPKIRRISLPETRKIRHEVLRKGMKYSTTLWEGDKGPGVMHFGLVQYNKILSIVSYFKKDTDYISDRRGIQLRGMATRPESQRCGHGTTLLNGTLEILKKMEIGDVVWANIRLSAAEFYEKNGFKFVSDEFEKPGIGPHRVGVLELN